jgi:hypothetical protein
MDKKIKVEELAVVVEAKNHNPTILNPDFLKYNGIVPPGWELAENPLADDHHASVKYQNGISILAQPDKVIFAEGLAEKAIVDLEVPAIALKYAQTLKHPNYTGIAIIVRGHAPFETELSARRFLMETLISPGPWREFGRGPTQVAVMFAYTLENAEFNLVVETDTYESSPAAAIPVVCFSGDFRHPLRAATKEERLSELYQLIENWQTDLLAFVQVVDEKFLAG